MTCSRSASGEPTRIAGVVEVIPWHIKSWTPQYEPESGTIVDIQRDNGAVKSGGGDENEAMHMCEERQSQTVRLYPLSANGSSPGHYLSRQLLGIIVI